MPDTAIHIEDFSFSFSQAPVLRHVSADVMRGEMLSIIGPNGAGKSTLLKCIMRILSGGSGTISVNGRSLADYSQKELARVLSYVPQGEGKLLPYSVEEFAMMGRYPHLSPFSSITDTDRTAVKTALEATGMNAFCGRQMSTLSGGECQKVLVAAAVAQGAGIILLDEPTAFLDPRHQDEIHRIIKRINHESGTTIVSVTHDINMAVLTSNRILALRRGEIAFCGTSDELMNNTVLRDIYGKKFLFANHPINGRTIIVPEEPSLT